MLGAVVFLAWVWFIAAQPVAWRRVQDGAGMWVIAFVALCLALGAAGVVLQFVRHGAFVTGME